MLRKGKYEINSVIHDQIVFNEVMFWHLDGYSHSCMYKITQFKNHLKYDLLTSRQSNGHYA